MKDAGCDFAIIVGPAQIGGKRYYRYFTDWNLQSFGGYLIVPVADQPMAVLRAWSQAYWSRRVDWITDIKSDRDPVGVVIDRMSEVEHGLGVVGIEYLPVTDHRRLESTFGSRLVDLTASVDELTAVKSDEEQSLLRLSGALFDAAWRVVLEQARPGMHEWELAAVAGRELLARGVSHSIILIGASSPRSPAACVGWPRDRQLGRDDVVQMSIEGPGPTGYCVEIGGTFTFGPATAEVTEQFAAQQRGMEEGVGRLVHGRTSGDVAGAVDRVFREAGYRTGYPGMHGIGLGIPELPLIEMDNPRPLAPGNVVAMHPNAVSERGVGTLTSRTYIVGTTEAEALSQLPFDLVTL
jgi:Xaa-Pro aminopeptidase